jgi:hypothetical protein
MKAAIEQEHIIMPSVRLFTEFKAATSKNEATETATIAYDNRVSILFSFSFELTLINILCKSIPLLKLLCCIFYSV